MIETTSLASIPHFNPRPPRGGRHFQECPRRLFWHISIHAPREGGDLLNLTLCPVLLHFNPRPPRGGRHGVTVTGGAYPEFQSTPPARGATEVIAASRNAGDISIHAPREGGDSKDAQFYLRIFDK